jgi:serine/threonine-protein phosphatase 2A regulatory subunit B
MFDRPSKRDLTFEACKEIAKPKTILKPKKVNTSIPVEKPQLAFDFL